MKISISSNVWQDPTTVWFNYELKLAIHIENERVEDFPNSIKSHSQFMFET